MEMSNCCTCGKFMRKINESDGLTFNGASAKDQGRICNEHGCLWFPKTGTVSYTITG